MSHDLPYDSLPFNQYVLLESADDPKALEWIGRLRKQGIMQTEFNSAEMDTSVGAILKWHDPHLWQSGIRELTAAQAFEKN